MNGVSKNDFYLIENRQPEGWDAFIPQAGLNAWHISYDADAWEEGRVNTASCQHVARIPVDSLLIADVEQLPSGAVTFTYHGYDALESPSADAPSGSLPQYDVMGRRLTEPRRGVLTIGKDTKTILF